MKQADVDMLENALAEQPQEDFWIVTPSQLLQHLQYNAINAWNCVRKRLLTKRRSIEGVFSKSPPVQKLQYGIGFPSTKGIKTRLF